MTYQVLARKWRPRSFKEMAGQGHVLKTLINALDNERLHHAYLFTGTRGVGKTTIARILAKCLNCEQGVSSEPCGQCSACREIDEGRFIDLIEVDAASRTKVEDTRELLDNVQYAPSRGRYKVYLIDEVHMLSGHSFNALLKTLEEPPPHVKFLLATTDPQKLPITILSRCLQFNLKNLSPERLMQHLKYILEQEDIAYEEAALWQLGRAAQGSVRDSLTLLDQAISFCGGKVSEAEVRSLLGTIDQAVVQKIVAALIDQDAEALLGVVAEVSEHAPDFSAVLESLLSYLHRLAIAQVVPDAIDNSQGDRDAVIEQAAKICAENIQLYYQVALKGRQDMPYAVDARAGLEMILLRMLAFTPDGVPNSPTAPLPDSSAGSEQAEEVKKKSPVNEEALAEGDSRPPAPVSPQFESVSEVSSPSPKDVIEDSEPGLQGDRQALDGEMNAATEARQVPPQDFAKAKPVSQDSAPGRRWIHFYQDLVVSGITKSIASNCTAVRWTEQQLDLLLDKEYSSLFTEEHERRICEAIHQALGKQIAVSIDIGRVVEETPAAYKIRMEKEQLDKAIDRFENDNVVQEILKRFSGSIQQNSIMPLSEEGK